jgi:hypothetical protein
MENTSITSVQVSEESISSAAEAATLNDYNIIAKYPDGETFFGAELVRNPDGKSSKKKNLLFSYLLHDGS